ncbi:ABC-type multidrug transport system, ATPase component [Schinkia azotoformans MEV2011]|uniref:ABC-type multidrug transport system, ATPase component n=1 Tax=Schinkia azotoformans MEV2011 TaxID=1348973 RepID=A0A072NUC8_SCHAZ|nr:ABC transporter ATP-binding protein [Schinkia azotoformans]KEF40478.1 ABC-type multidrug transport system, ATPase component [Schinkia azotoformans MEV2011]MEC1696114.1 ABC transporter ATP-binding protein [Schinkia azotoformans]MEC1716672.1 ABC transporter ATP-binding protein [Schinkia azotoformans]MEC1725383.1 ABC transporter ATP-binding protein [Schinkia azotoformans]MEC1739511.1 ABC transporter ATP-binding protein [Schinkia azotoformans]
MNHILEVKNLTKKYLNKTVLDQLSLNIEEGKIVGILGPNGSGKTTLIKILTGLLRQTSGEVLIDGRSVGVGTKAVVSYLPDRNFLYKWMKIDDACNLYKDFYSDFDENKFAELLDFMKLEKNMKIDTLSKGMHEKLNLSLVLSRNAKLYILDEPIAGVDPVARDQILNAIINNFNEKSSMIITTHLVRDMENMLDDVVFLKDGHIVLTGNAEALREEKGMQIDDIYKVVFGE